MMTIVLSLWALPPTWLLGNPGGSLDQCLRISTLETGAQGLVIGSLARLRASVVYAGGQCVPGGCGSVRQQLPLPTPAWRRGGISSSVFGEESLLLGCSESCHRFRPVFKDIIRTACVKVFCAQTGLYFPSIAWFLCSYIEQH